MKNEQPETKCEYCGECAVVLEIRDDPFLFCTFCAKRNEVSADILRLLTPEVLTKLRTMVEQVELHNASIDVDTEDLD